MLAITKFFSSRYHGSNTERGSSAVFAGGARVQQVYGRGAEDRGELGFPS